MRKAKPCAFSYLDYYISMSRTTTLVINEFYHVYNRGTEKRKIFITKNDYERFVILLYLANSVNPIRIDMRRDSFKDLLEIDRGKNFVDIGAYCLMPNHFHLLLKEKTENGISLFMQKLTTAYTMYFNKKHERNGVLFQGVFKAEHLKNDNYLKYIYSYIHLNPIKLIDPTWKEKGIKNLSKTEKFLEQYQYSSYGEYINIDREEKVIINKEAFPEYFENADDFQKTVKFWLSLKKE